MKREGRADRLRGARGARRRESRGADRSRGLSSLEAISLTDQLLRLQKTAPWSREGALILPSPSMPQVVVGMLLRREAPSCGWSVQLLHELSSSAKV